MTTSPHGRAQIQWPDLGSPQGAPLHAELVAGIASISNNLLGRWSGSQTIAASGTFSFEHNFGLAIANLRIRLYESGAELAESAVTSGFTLAEVDANEISVTNTGGSPRTVQVYVEPIRRIRDEDLDPGIDIPRANIAAGTASHVLINDGSGEFSSEAQLAVSRGGTGLGSLGTALQILRVNAGGTALEYAAGGGDINNGGNTTGAAISIGTNDNFGLDFKTNNTIKGSVDTAGAFTFGPSGFTGTHNLISNRTNVSYMSVDYSGNELNWNTRDDDDRALLLNYRGYADGFTRFRTVQFYDGKSNLVGSYGNTGAWSFGVAGGDPSVHKFNQGLTIEQISGSAQLELKRTTTNAGSVFLGSADGDFRIGTTAGSFDLGFATAAGSWSFGPSSAGATLEHTVFGHVKIGTSAASVGPNSTAVRVFGNKKSSLVFTDSSSSFIEMLGGTYTADASTYLKTEANNGGGRYLIIPQATASANVHVWHTAQLAGAADSADTMTEVGGVAQNGSWTFGVASGSSSSDHLFRSGDNTNVIARTGNFTGTQTSAFVLGTITANRFWMAFDAAPNDFSIRYDASSSSIPSLQLANCSSAGSWTFGPNANYTNAGRVDVRVNGGLGFRYPTADTVSHRIFVDDGSSIVSGQVPMVFVSDYTGTGSNRVFSWHNGAVSGTTNEIGFALESGAWTFGSYGSFVGNHTLLNNGGASDVLLNLEKNNVVSTTSRLVSCFLNSGIRGYIRTNSGATSMEFEAVSDRRIKENIENISGALAKINAVRPVTFSLKDNPGIEIGGFVAQEFWQVFPSAVTRTDDGEGIDLPAGTDPWTMSEACLTPYLVKAIQELKAELDAAKDRIELLEA